MIENKKVITKIIADSSADLETLGGFPFASVPLKIVTTEKEYVDDAQVDVEDMVNFMLHYKGKSSTSCPNPTDWFEAFGDADQVFCVPITRNLSGSYNAACVAKQMYEEKYPERKVYVVDTLTAGPEMKLIVEKLHELIESGKDYDGICDAINEYMKGTGLFFLLESMKNLANNGRVSPLVAKMAGLLGIRLLGVASARGDIEPINKCRGEKKALDTVIEQLKKYGYKGGKIRISHCLNEEAALKLKNLVLNEWQKAKVEIYKCKALCSFYAEKGGLLVGFEKF